MDAEEITVTVAEARVGARLGGTTVRVAVGGLVVGAGTSVERACARPVGVALSTGECGTSVGRGVGTQPARTRARSTAGRRARRTSMDALALLVRTTIIIVALAPFLRMTALEAAGPAGKNGSVDLNRQHTWGCSEPPGTTPGCR